jgi:hypothetical protein
MAPSRPRQNWQRGRDAGAQGRLHNGRRRGRAGAAILQALGIGVTGGGDADLQSIISSVAGGGVGGAVMMTVVGLIRNAMAKN